MRLSGLVVSLACAGALALAAPASATPPERFSIPEEVSDPHFLQCDGFEIGLEAAGTRDVTIFFDADGTPVRFRVQVRVRETLTNSVTGRAIGNSAVFQEQFTRIDGTDAFTHVLVGYRHKGLLPGEGVAFRDVGRIVYGPDEEILASPGRHDLLVEELYVPSVFCAALA